MVSKGVKNRSYHTPKSNVAMSKFSTKTSFDGTLPKFLLITRYENKEKQKTIHFLLNISILFIH